MAYNYARRVALAKARGFVDPTGRVNPYTYYRRVTEFATSSEQFVTSVGDGAGVDTEGDEHNLDTAKLLYEAFVLGDEDDYSVHMQNGKVVVVYENGKPKGAKAKVIIDVLHYVSSAAQWRRLYPTKTRFGHLVEKPKPKRASKPARKRAKRTRR